MSKRGRVVLASCLAIIMVLGLAVGAFGATGAKKLSAIFRNIKLNVNGKVLQTSEEPFIINGRTYVPLRVVSEALGAWVDWNEKTSVITISGASGTKALEDQLHQKDIQIIQLQLQIQELQAKLESGTSSSSASDEKNIRDLEKELNDDYDRLEGIRINDISLSGNKNKVYVTVEIDADKNDREWKDIRKSDIEDWLEDLCYDIQRFYDGDTDIIGEIIDEDDDTLVDFSKDGDDDVEVEIKSGNKTVDEVEDDLDGREYSIDYIDFEIRSINYNTGSDVIYVTLRATDDASSLTSSKIKTLVRDAGEDIADTFERDSGENPETVIFDVYDEDGSYIGEYEYDVDSETVS